MQEGGTFVVNFGVGNKKKGNISSIDKYLDSTGQGLSTLV